ncbi:glycoside hydrolase family 16 protein, partial [Suhomyces tanzawaensis NRRL Y-17324]
MFLPVLLILLLVTHTLQTACDAVQDPSCLMSNSALQGTFSHIFSSPSPQFFAQTTPSGVEYCDQGLKLTLRDRFDNPSLVSKFYILHGKVEVKVKAAEGQGVISSCYLQSDDQDEIDIVEGFGGDPFKVQSNFFVKGNTSNYDRDGYHRTSQSTLDSFITYGIEWTSHTLTWYINGDLVRVLDRNNEHGYPTSPMQVKFSLWAGGDPTNHPGTVEWAGGLTNYVEAPFSMYVESLHVEDYSSGRHYKYGNGPNQW